MSNKSEHRYICLNTSFKTFKSVLLELRKKSITKKEIAEQTGLSVRTIGKPIPLMNELELISSDDHRYRLTDTGILLADYFDKNNKKGIRGTAEYILKKSLLLSKAYEFLQANYRISNEELGSLLSSYFDKNWNPDTTIIVGRSCRDILAGLCLIGKSSGGGKKYKIDKERKLIPSINANQIVSIIKIIGENEAVSVKDISSFKGIKNDTVSQVLSFLNEVGLLDRINNHYKLSESGKNLKNAIETFNESEESRIFRETITGYRSFVFFLRFLHEKKRKSFKTYEIGDLIEEYNRASWSKRTKKLYAQKFISWIRKAGLIESSDGRHKFTREIDNILPIGQPSQKPRVSEDKIKNGLSDLVNNLVIMMASENWSDNDEYLASSKEIISNLRNQSDEDMLNLALFSINEFINQADGTQNKDNIISALKIYGKLQKTLSNR